MIRRCPNPKCFKPFVKTSGCNAVSSGLCTDVRYSPNSIGRLTTSHRVQITCTDKNCKTKSCCTCCLCSAPPSPSRSWVSTRGLFHTSSADPFTLDLCKALIDGYSHFDNGPCESVSFSVSSSHGSRLSLLVPGKGKLYKDDSVILSVRSFFEVESHSLMFLTRLQVKQVRDQGIAGLETEEDRKAARRLQVG